jgi:hypothetical protein
VLKMHGQFVMSPRTAGECAVYGDILRSWQAARRSRASPLGICDPRIRCSFDQTASPTGAASGFAAGVGWGQPETEIQSGLERSDRINVCSPTADPLLRTQWSHRAYE